MARGRVSSDKSKATLLPIIFGGILEKSVSNMAALLDPTSIQDEILGAWERPARKTASPCLELGGGECWASNGGRYQGALWVTVQQRRRTQPVGDEYTQDLKIEPMGHDVQSSMKRNEV